MADHLRGKPSPKEKTWLDGLKVVAQALDNAKISYFLDTGTLLGAIRDGAFITWDNDIDLGVFDCGPEDPRMDHFLAEIERAGFVANRAATGVGLFSPKGVEINLKTYTEDGPTFVGDYSFHTHPSGMVSFLFNVIQGYHISSHGVSPAYILKRLLIFMRSPLRVLFGRVLESRMVHSSLVARVEKADVVPLGQLNFYGVNFPIPGNCTRYLAKRYGENWSVPVREYDYTKDDQSILRS